MRLIRFIFAFAAFMLVLALTGCVVGGSAWAIKPSDSITVGHKETNPPASAPKQSPPAKASEPAAKEADVAKLKAELTERDKLATELTKLKAERDKLTAKCDEYIAKCETLEAERDKIQSERDTLWAHKCPKQTHQGCPNFWDLFNPCPPGDAGAVALQNFAKLCKDGKFKEACDQLAAAMAIAAEQGHGGECYAAVFKLGPKPEKDDDKK